jgi:ABC-type Co2+ transport system permease subunit
MSHLHFPDGVLPLWLWLGGLVVALALLIRASRQARAANPQRIAWQGALGALMLAAMAIPLGPVEYHLTLAGPVGVLLGGTGAFQVAFIVSAILAFIGHGGLTTIGLNALLVGLAAGVARRLFMPLRGRMGAATSLAIATAAGQALAGAAWFAIVAVTLRAGAAGDGRLPPVLAVGIPLMLAGIAAEALVAFGVGRFLARVRPELLGAAPAVSAAPANAPTDAPTPQRPGEAA